MNLKWHLLHMINELVYKDFFDVFGKKFSWTWIGINDITQENQWVFDIDSTGNNISYTNWYANDSSGATGSNENCAVFW